MSNIQQMLGMNGGSFQKAEQMALDRIAQGMTETWLDLALLMHVQGNIDGTRQAQAEYEKLYPDCPRLRFGRTWFKLYDGDLKGGLEHVEAGRAIGCRGEHDFSKFRYPRWDGRADLTGKTVVLYGEGGHGDQIMGLRTARWLTELGAVVTVACSRALMGLFASQREYTVIDSTFAYAAHADYWVPMMSGFGMCRRTWDTIWTGPYIRPPVSAVWSRIIPKTDNLNIGIRWRGNPEFEHEQLRWFPPELMLQITKLKGANFWSLQKDDPQVALPDHVNNLEPLLGDWEQTAAAIAQMDLVITSCTSIAHLAAAMNKPTWVVVPVMPYYPWARPGRRSNWYPSVTLFRQRCYNDWIPPFIEIEECLKRKLKPTGVTEIGLEEFYEEHKPSKFANNWFVEGAELSVLEGLIKKHSVKTILEIGINKGETAKKLLGACPEITRYTGIEITEDAASDMNQHQQHERTYAGKEVGALAKGDKRVKIFMSKNGSRDFHTNEKFDMVFIDGNHALGWVWSDIELSKRVGARVIAWHDYGTEPGVTQAVDEVGAGVVRVMKTRVAYQVRE
jgi:hypothetical protein